MCGIAGTVWTAEAATLDPARARMSVTRMTCALARRGPDGEAVEAWQTAALGHRRLAIFDLSDAGRQPMLSPDRSIGVVFNGAIYNFLSLRKELEARGYEFHSQTDTEVLVHGYREWGIDNLVAKLKGMFAFAVWDDRVRKLFLVRDPLGVKPLAYTLLPDGSLAFASTVRALKQGGFVKELNERAIAEYLHFGFVTDAQSIYREARKVPAATIIEWSDGKLKDAREYWTPPIIQEASGRKSVSRSNFEDAVSETERLFLQAVERRLHADVPVGALLSGGVDSSLVCWAIKHLGGDITAFTVGTPNDPLDESADARATAETLGIRHQILELAADSAPNVDELVRAYPEPFACASALGMLGLSRRVKEEATVLLTGDGGDDVFLGYPEHRHLWFAGKANQSFAGSGLLAVARKGVPRVGALQRVGSFLDYAAGGLSAVASARDGWRYYERNKMLGARLRDVDVPQLSITESRGAGARVLEEFISFDRATRFTGEYLPKVDGATMYHALEARSPFLDIDLWSYAAGLPFAARLYGNKLKAVLRELARRRVGERVATGRKRGFGVPVGRWMKTGWRTRVEESFADSLLAREGLIDGEATRKVFSRVVQASDQSGAPNQLWYVFVLESWLRYEQEAARDESEITTNAREHEALSVV